MAVSRLAVVLWGESGWLGYSDLRPWFQDFAPFPYSGTLTGAFLLGWFPASSLWLFGRLISAGRASTWWPTLRHVCEWVNRLPDFLWRRALASASERDELLELQLRALETKSPLQVTLRTRKVYVGWIVGTEDLRPDMRYLKLVPTYSGFRSEDDLGFWLSEVYEDVILILERFLEYKDEESDRQRLQEMQRLINIDDIVSATFFDEDAYQRHVERAVESEETFEESSESPTSSLDGFLRWLESGIRWIRLVRRERNQSPKISSAA